MESTISATEQLDSFPIAAPSPGTVPDPPAVQGLTIEQFRILTGILPLERSSEMGKGRPRLRSKSRSHSSRVEISSSVSAKLRRQGTSIARLRFWKPPHSKNLDVEANAGIYVRICRDEHHIKWQYRSYNYALYIFLVAQLIVSSILVILGALSHDFHIATAILGAVNGTVAGILGLLKGQDLPTKLIKYEYALQGVRREIEWMEREVIAGKVVTFEDVDKLEKRYERVRGDAQRGLTDPLIKNKAEGVPGVQSADVRYGRSRMNSHVGAASVRYK